MKDQTSSRFVESYCDLYQLLYVYVAVIAIGVGIAR